MDWFSTNGAYVIEAVLVLAGAFCAGVAFGARGKNRAELAAYRDGQRSGHNAAADLYARPPIDDLPKIMPRVAPFAGRPR